MSSNDYDASSRSGSLPSVEDLRMNQADRRQSATSTSGASSAGSKVSDVETAFPDSDSETGYVHDQLPSVEDIQMNGAPRRSGRAKCFLMTTILVIVTIVGVSVALALVKQGGGASDEEFPMELSGSNNNVPFYEPPVTMNDTPAPVNPTPVTAAPQQPEASEPATATTFPPEATATVSPEVSSEAEAAARLQKIMEMISSAGVSDMKQMQTFGTPQQTAVIWMAESDPTPVSLDNTNAVIEQYAVLVFFFATNGNNWPNQLNFKTAGGVCQWYINGFASDKQTARKYGVTCDKDGSVNTIHIRKYRILLYF